jgi:hypothetical protein
MSMNRALAIFTPTPAAKIKTAQVLLAAAETRIGQLVAERDLALIGDSAEEIIRLDRLLDEQRRAVTIHRDRIAALQVEQRRQDWQRAEQARTDAIARTLEPFEADCGALADELAKTLAHACELFSRNQTQRHARKLAGRNSGPADLWRPDVLVSG